KKTEGLTLLSVTLSTQMWFKILLLILVSPWLRGL
ncbi:MAG: hypothetical protein AVDCRST_MAG96-252, partial [uncultured Segetibacter sp.]